MTSFDFIREKLKAEKEDKQKAYELLVDRKMFGMADVFMGKADEIDDVMKIIDEAEKECGKDMNVTTNNGWIPCSERLPNKDEYTKNDGRFIATDGNRVYQGLFDIYRGIFVKDSFGFVPVEDECVIAWQPLPEPYKGE